MELSLIKVNKHGVFSPSFPLFSMEGESNRASKNIFPASPDRAAKFPQSEKSDPASEAYHGAAGGP